MIRRRTFGEVSSYFVSSGHSLILVFKDVVDEGLRDSIESDDDSEDEEGYGYSSPSGREVGLSSSEDEDGSSFNRTPVGPGGRSSKQTKGRKKKHGRSGKRRSGKRKEGLFKGDDGFLELLRYENEGGNPSTVT